MKVSFVQELSYDASFFANSQDTLNPSCCRARLYNAPVVFFLNVWFCSASRIFLFWLCATLAIIKPNLWVECWNRRGSSLLQFCKNITDWVANVAISHYDWWAPRRSAALTRAAASLVQWSKRRNMSAFGLLPMKYCPLEEDMTVSCGRKFALSLCSLTSRTKTLRILMRNGACVCLCLCVCVLQANSRRSWRILCLRPTVNTQDLLRWCATPSRRVWSAPEWAGGGLPLPQLLPCLMPTSSSTPAGESLARSAAWCERSSSQEFWLPTRISVCVSACAWGF